MFEKHARWAMILAALIGLFATGCCPPHGGSASAVSVFNCDYDHAFTVYRRVGDTAYNVGGRFPRHPTGHCPEGGQGVFVPLEHGVENTIRVVWRTNGCQADYNGDVQNACPYRDTIIYDGDDDAPIAWFTPEL